MSEDEALATEMAAIEGYDKQKDLLFIIHVIKLYKVEDWYHDRKT